MRKLKFIIIAVLMHIGLSYSAPSIGNYCSVPVLTSFAASPNILFVVDVSGSMDWWAYDDYNHNTVYEGYFIPESVYRYDSSNDVWVEVDESPDSCPANNVWLIRLGFSDMSDGNFSGSCLNFIFMTRIDLVRWALTGGKPASCNGVSDNDCAPELFYTGVDNNNSACDSEGCTLEANSDVRVKVPWSRIFDALVYKMKEMNIRPRFGVMFYGYRYIPGVGDQFIRHEKVYIGDFVEDNSIDEVFPYKNLIMHINGIDIQGATPTAPALWDTYNYFAQHNPEYGGFIPQQGSGDKWRNPIYHCIDKNNDGQCQDSEFEKVQCAKNFVILLTDGQWNFGGPPNDVEWVCTIEKGFEEYSADPVVPAYWLHAKGFTNQVTGDYLNVEAIYTIGLWLGGTGENSLKHVAIYGSFDLSSGTWPGGMSNYPLETGGPIEDCCSGQDCGMGSPVTPIPPSSPDWDSDGDGNPDTFYNARDANQIRESIEKIILDIMKNVSAGSGVASMSSRSDVASVVLQPSYYPFYVSPENEKTAWLGLLSSFWLDMYGNFREDTVFSLQLNIDKDPDADNEDRIFFMDYESAIGPHAIFVNMDPDLNGNNQCIFLERKSIFNIKTISDFACKLASSDASARKIKYNDGKNNLRDFISNNTDTLDLLHIIWSGIDPALSTTDVQCIIDYLRGKDISTNNDCTTEYVQRLRKINLNDICGIDETAIWKLGDIMNSAPTVVSFEPNNIYHTRYLDNTYKEYITSDNYRRRTTFAFVGANDGMLHAFRVGYIQENKYCTNDPSKSCKTSQECGEGGFCIFDPDKPVKLINSYNDSSTTKIGKEEWAYIPYNAIPYLLWYGHKSYCHIHTVDYTAIVVDASINGSANSSKTASSWRTLLIGIMGFGGQHIITGDDNGNGVCDQAEINCREFASSIFVFDITEWLSDPDNENPILMWEKSLPEKTLTLSYPVIIRRGDKDKNGEWYIVLGSGPKDPYGNDFVSSPKLHFIDLRTGNIVKSVELPLPSNVPGAAVGNIKAVDVNNDYQDDVLYFGVYGETTDEIQWGTLYRLPLINEPGSYKDIAALSSSDISEVIRLSDFCQAEYCPTVFAQPEVGIDMSSNNNPRLWLFFGTGKMLNEDDKLTKKRGYKNYLIGLVDACWNPAFQSDPNDPTTQCPQTYTIDDLKNTTNEKTIVRLDPAETVEICTCDTVCAPDCSSECWFETVYVKVGDPISYIEDVTDLGYQGWYIEYPGRVVMSTPLLVETILDALSFEPTDNICGGLGYTYLTAVNYKSGTPPPKPALLGPEGVIETNPGEGEIGGGGTGIEIGPGAPPMGGKAMDVNASAERVGQYEKKIQLSTGVTVRQEQQIRFSGGKYILWMER